MIDCCLEHKAVGGRVRLLYGAGLAPALVGCVAIALFDPAAGGYPVCPFYALTGLYCPGCGTLRALHRLMRGDFAAAADYNVLAVAMLPVLLYAIWWSINIVFRGRRLKPIFVPAPAIWLLFATVTSYWILRNLEYGPLAWLAPGAS